MLSRDIHVPSAGNDLGELMSAEGYTEADIGPPEPCAICEEPDGDCCSCYDEDEQEDDDIDVAAYTDAWGW